MNLYISDIHFGHTNVIGFDNRPFKDRDEMDETIIENWNNRVNPDDHVYIVGDVSYHAGKTDDWYLKQLKGHKHLIVGNHDRFLIQNEKALSYLESVDKMLNITDTDKKIVLCHFPLASWSGENHGSWLIYGHIHASIDDVYYFMAKKDRALNAGACINNYVPVTFDELVKNNHIFQEKAPANLRTDAFE